MREHQHPHSVFAEDEEPLRQAEAVFHDAEATLLITIQEKLEARLAHNESLFQQKEREEKEAAAALTEATEKIHTLFRKANNAFRDDDTGYETADDGLAEKITSDDELSDDEGDLKIDLKSIPCTSSLSSFISYNSLTDKESVSDNETS